MRKVSSRSRRPLLAVFITIAALGLVLRLPLLRGGELDSDEGVYWMSLRSMTAGHPLYRSIYSSQPPAFLTLVQPIYAAVGHSLIGARLAVLLVSILGCVALVRLLSTTVGTPAAMVAALLVATDPLAIRSSVTLQPDAPSVWLGVIALALLFEARQCDDRRALALRVLAGGAFALAALTKLLVVGDIVPMAVLIVTDSMTSRGPARARVRTLLIAAAEIGVGGAAVGAAFLLPYLGTWSALWAQVVADHLTARAVHQGGLATLTSNLRRELPLAVLAGAGLLVTWWRDWKYGLVLTAWLAASVALLLVQRPVFPHHVLVLVPALAVPAAASLGLLVSSAPRWTLTSAVAIVGAASCVVIAVDYTAASATLVTPDNTMKLASAMKTATPRGTTIVTDAQFAAARAGLDTPPSLVDTSFVRLASSGITAPDIEAIIDNDKVGAVCFATGRLTGVPGLTQWVQAHFPNRERIDGALIYWR